MLEPLLALLSLEEQELLEKRFGFDPLRWGRASAIFLLGVSGINIFIAIGRFAGAGDTFWDFFWLLVGGYLLIEQFRRRRKLRRGTPSGSVLGVLVRPAAKALLGPLGA